MPLQALSISVSRGSDLCGDSLRSLVRLDENQPKATTIEFINEFVDRDLLVSKREFQTFLETRDLNWTKLSPDGQNQEIASYLAQIGREYNGRRLELKQAESLREILLMHGMKSQDSMARNTLERVSRFNLARILSGKEIEPVPEVAKILQTAPKLRRYFVHNTAPGTRSAYLEVIPLLSARRLETLGLHRGVNSQLAYNRVFLRSDDAVFFHVRHARNAKDAGYGSGYGRQALVLDFDYASERGMVSIYNMHDSDLQGAKHLSTPRAKRLKGAKAPWGLKPEVPESAIPVQQLNQWKYARERLHRFDFTARDFDELCDKLMISSLNRLFREDAGRFGSFVRDLNSEDIFQAESAANELIFRMHQLPSRYELKVPVAVPGSALTNP